MEIVADIFQDHRPKATTPDPKGFHDFRWTPIKKTLPDIIEALAKQPNCPVLAFQLGVTFAKKGSYLEAERILRRLLKRENNFEVLEAISTCLYHLERWNECIHFARQALMLGEGFRDQRFGLLKFLGNSLIRVADLDGAREAYEKAFVLFPGSDALQVNFGTLWIQKGDWNQAIECFRHALFLNPDNDHGWVGLGLCHRVHGDLELSFANAERALDQNPMNETALSLLIEWSRGRSEFFRAQDRFMSFTDRGGFSDSLSGAWISKARSLGEGAIAAWEEFHCQLRSNRCNG